MSKRAIIVGINYENDRDSKLNGCINDANNMEEFLKRHRNYNSNEIIKMTDKTITKPTQRNIIRNLVYAAIDAIKGSVNEIWIHYSGHGHYIRDSNGDENDGRDEVLVPLDYKKKGFITDDILAFIFSFIPSHVKVTCIIDSCHSGTACDLKYRYLGNSSNMIENIKRDIKCNVLMLSGCTDAQYSADAYIESNFVGAMTYCYLKTIENNNNQEIKCDKLLNNIRNLLRQLGYSQTPQINGSKQINDDTIGF